MNNFFIPPAFVFIIAAAFLPLFSGKVRSVYLLLIPVVGFANLINIPHGNFWAYSFLDYGLHLIRVDKVSLLFGYAFHLITFVTLIYALNFKRNMEYVAGLIYAGGALGAVFAGDLITLFIFWELMTISSTFLVWARGTESSIGSGYRYMLVHLLGGLVLLIGIILHGQETGSMAFNHIGLGTVGSYFIFFGFGVNCAWPFLHSWLTDAYPEASIAGTVFLSAFTTKTAVYALARGYAGTDALIWIGVGMAAFPIFYAVIENDLRRVLAYSLINQVGFMVVGIGIGTELAVNGALAHVFTDIMFKALLFMGMGAVLYRTGKIKATELGGLYKYMPYTTIFTIVGAASISAFPLFSAFASKSMVMSAAGHESLYFVWLVLLFASAGVFHHAGIKIPFFAFFGHDSGLKPKEAPMNMLIAMGILAFLNIFIGTFPSFLYNLLPYPVEYKPYTADHVIFQLQILLFSALAFTLLLRAGIYPAEIRSTNIDSDWTYRRGYRAFLWLIDKPVLGFMNYMKKLFFESIPGKLKHFSKNPMAIIMLTFSNSESRKHITDCIINEEDAYLESMNIHLSIGLSVILIIAFLVIYLLVFMISLL